METSVIRNYLRNYKYRIIGDQDHIFDIDLDNQVGSSSLYLWHESKVDCLKLFVPSITEVYERLLHEANKVINDLNYGIYYGAISIMQKDSKDEEKRYFVHYNNAITLNRGEGVTLTQEEFDEYIEYINYITNLVHVKITDIEREFTNGVSV